MNLVDGLLNSANNANNNRQPPPQQPDRGGLQIQLQVASESQRKVSEQRADGQKREHPPQRQIMKQQLDQKLYRKYKFPASLNEAKVHKRAMMNGYKTPMSLGENKAVPTKMCPCCQNFVNTQEIRLNYSTYPKKLDKDEIMNAKIWQNVTHLPLLTANIFRMQPGDALFFCFVKLLITYLIIRVILYDGYNLYTNMLGTYCELPINLHSTTICVAPLVDFTATPNKNTPLNQQLFFTLDILNLVFTLVSIVFFFYGRVKLKQLYELLEGWDVTEDDYTLLIEDIPLIPYDANDDRVRDVTSDYKEFLADHIEGRVRSWLNRFYSYQKQSAIETKLDQDFYKYVYQQKKQTGEAELYDQIVANINLCFDLTQLENLQIQRQNLVNHFSNAEGKKQSQAQDLFDDDLEESDENGNPNKNAGDEYVSNLSNQIQIINNHYIKVCQRINNTMSTAHDGDELNVSNLKISRFVGKAFVSLKYQHYRRYLLDRYEEDSDFIKVNGNKIPLKISAATKPYDILWNNMKISDQFRTQQLRKSYLLVTISIVVAGAILYGLTELKTQSYVNASINKKENIFESMFVLSLPIWTYIVNYTLAWGLNELNSYERHKTKTEQLSYLILKNIVSKFFNTAFIYALIYYFGPKINFLSANGLVYTIVSLVLINAGINLALELFQPFLLYKDWTNKNILESVDKDGKIGLFQIQLNKLVQSPPYTYDYSYSYYLQMVYIVAFYGYLVPLITPLTIIAFIAQYWVDKRNLLGIFSSPIDLGYILTDKIWRALELTLLLHAIGHIMWSSALHKNPAIMTQVCNWTVLGISILYTILILFFNKYVQNLAAKFQDSNGIYTRTYQEEFCNFSKTYNNLNPATSFAEKPKHHEEGSGARFTDYSILEPQRVRFQNKFVPENEQELKKIWENTEDRTTIEKINQGIKKDFTTIFCC